MLKRKFSLVTALIMMITLFVGQMPAWAKVELPITAGYTIIDSAYNNGTYVVMAKNMADDNNAAKLYTSVNGREWLETLSVTQGKKWGNPESKQNLLWWNAQNVFVASVGNLVYTSSNGMAWKASDVLSNDTAYAMLDERDGMLALLDAQYGKISFADSVTNKTEAVSIAGKQQQFGTFGMGPVVDGTPSYFAMNRYEYYRNTLPDATGNWAGDRTIKAIDAKYVPSYNGWILLNHRKEFIDTLNYKGDMARINVLVDGTAVTDKFTAIGVDNDVLVAGTENGTVYVMSAPASRPSGNTEWTKIVSNVTEINESITDIVSVGNGSFFMTSATGVYKLSKTENGYTYSDMLSYQDIEEVKISGTLPFAQNIKLLGGAYSEDLNSYVAYGNDKDGNGHIYYSEDGINWETTGVGTETLTTGTSEDARNLAVWWPAQQQFIISNSTTALNGSVWYSADGRSWKYDSNSQFGRMGDIAVAGDNLYSANNDSQRAIKKYTSAIPVKPESVIFSETNVSYSLNTMAISDDEKLIFVARDAYAYVYNPDNTESTFNGGYIAGSPKLEDAHWNNSVRRFVSVASDKNRIYLMDENGTRVNSGIDNFVPNAEAGNLAAIETNGVNYLTGDVNGKLFFLDNVNISSSSKFDVVTFDGIKENTLPVTNIFKGADNKYMVTVSDGTESDLLIVEADGSSYQKVSELLQPTSVSAGDTLKISVKTENYTEADKKITMIAAIYDSTGAKLLQAASEEKTMQLNQSEYLSMEIVAGDDIPNDAKVKVFLWDSVNGMVPVAGAAKSFF